MEHNAPGNMSVSLLSDPVNDGTRDPGVAFLMLSDHYFELSDTRW